MCINIVHILCVSQTTQIHAFNILIISLIPIIQQSKHSQKKTVLNFILQLKSLAIIDLCCHLFIVCFFSLDFVGAFILCCILLCIQYPLTLNSIHLIKMDFKLSTLRFHVRYVRRNIFVQHIDYYLVKSFKIDEHTW